jgi:Meiotically Up-regulated Gene 113 (MUG113) protein
MIHRASGYYLYLIGEAGTDNTKIGITQDHEERLRGLQTGNPRKLEFLHTWELKTNSPQFVERFIQNEFQHSKLIGEWFSLPAGLLRDQIENSLGLRQGYDVGSNCRK